MAPGSEACVARTKEEGHMQVDVDGKARKRSQDIDAKTGGSSGPRDCEGSQALVATKSAQMSSEDTETADAPRTTMPKMGEAEASTPLQVCCNGQNKAISPEWRDGDEKGILSSHPNGSMDADETVLLRIPEEELECPLCLKMLYDPIVTPQCGHTFCRSCLQRAVSTKPNCPICRHPIPGLNPETHPVNSLLTHLLSKYATKQYSDRSREIKIRKREGNCKYGIFTSEFLSFPGGVIYLHLFELRYRRLMMRALTADRKFVMIRRGDSIGCLVHIRESRSTPDGRFYITGDVKERCKVQRVCAEEGEFGLEIGEVELFEEGDLAEDEKVRLNDALAALTSRLERYRQSVGEIEFARLVRREGEVPHSPEDLCWWICRATYGNDDLRSVCLETEGLVARIYLCIQVIKLAMRHGWRRTVVSVLSFILVLAVLAFLLLSGAFQVEISGLFDFGATLGNSFALSSWGFFGKSSTL